LCPAAPVALRAAVRAAAPFLRRTKGAATRPQALHCTKSGARENPWRRPRHSTSISDRIRGARIGGLSFRRLPK